MPARDRQRVDGHEGRRLRRGRPREGHGRRQQRPREPPPPLGRTGHGPPLGEVLRRDPPVPRRGRDRRRRDPGRRGYRPRRRRLLGGRGGAARPGRRPLARLQGLHGPRALAGVRRCGPGARGHRPEAVCVACGYPTDLVQGARARELRARALGPLRQGLAPSQADGGVCHRPYRGEQRLHGRQHAAILPGGALPLRPGRGAGEAAPGCRVYGGGRRGDASAARGDGAGGRHAGRRGGPRHRRRPRRCRVHQAGPTHHDRRHLVHQRGSLGQARAERRRAVPQLRGPGALGELRRLAGLGDEPRVVCPTPQPPRGGEGEGGSPPSPSSTKK